MIRGEFKKIFKDRFAIAFFILFVFVDSYMIYQSSATIRNYENMEIFCNIKQIYNEVKGVITDEKVRQLCDSSDDKTLAIRNLIYEEIQHICTYQNRAATVSEAARYNKEMYEKMKLHEQAELNRHIEEAFAGRSISEYYSMNGINDYLEHDYSTLMVIFLIIVVVNILFYRDQQLKMNLIVETSRNGGKKLALIRLGVLMSVSVLLMLFFRILEFVTFDALYGFEGLHMPLYSIAEFEGTMYTGSILSFMGVELLLKCLGVLLFTVIAGVLCYFVPRRSWGIGSFAIIYIGCIYGAYTGKVIGSPIQLLDGYRMFKDMADNTYIVWMTMAGIALLMCIFALKSSKKFAE